VLHALRDREASSRCQVDFASIATALAAITPKRQRLPPHAFAPANAAGQSFSSNKKPLPVRWWWREHLRRAVCVRAARTIVQWVLARKLLKWCLALVVKSTLPARGSALTRRDRMRFYGVDFVGKEYAAARREQNAVLPVGV